MVGRRESAAADVGPTTRWGMLSRILRKIDILTSTTVIKINEHSVVVQSPDDSTRKIHADTVVIAAGLRSNNNLSGYLKKSGVEYHLVGSCSEPGQIAEVVEDAFTLGCKI